MSEAQHKSMLMVIVPQVVELIGDALHVGEVEATGLFLESCVYSLLEDERTKLWHLSPRSLLMMFEEERACGSITFPEEA